MLLLRLEQGWEVELLNIKMENCMKWSLLRYLYIYIYIYISVSIYLFIYRNIPAL